MTNNNTINELEAVKADLLARVEQIDITINTLRAVSSFSTNGEVKEQAHNNTVPNKYPGYDKTAPMKNKLAFILKKENRFLHIREVAEILHSLEPKIEVKDFISKLYPAIADLKRAGAITKFSIGTSNVNSFWGSKNWLDEEGNIKEEHKYDESRITNVGAEPIEI